MIFAGILAGGIGSRMNMSEMPKQFLPLGEKPILIHTLEKFLLSTSIDMVYVGVHAQWQSHAEDIVSRYITRKRDCVRIVPGGSKRNETIMNIVEAIESEYGESKEHFILTHDSVRPFVTARIIDENIEKVKEYKVCDTVVQATDTIVVSEDGVKISDIPLRSIMYQGQTPQTFQLTLLKELYMTLSEEEKGLLTDACKIAMVRAHPVYLVNGEGANIKITTISDYKIAQAMVGGQVID